MSNPSVKPVILAVLGALCVGLVGAFAPAAHAQDVIRNSEYGVEITKPAEWDQTTGNEKAVAVFTHNATQSQIEIVPTKLMTADVADVFFDTFHKTLKDSNFEQVGEPKEETIGGHKGRRTEYKFSHSGVDLKVHVFGFVKDNTSWLVVGYMQAGEEAKILEAYKATVESMKFTK